MYAVVAHLNEITSMLDISLNQTIVKITKLIVSKDNAQLAYTSNRWIRIPSYSSKRDRELCNKAS